MGMPISGPASGTEPEVMLDMNATPLIDVMMVLLIMLIITIPAQLHSVNLDMPLPNPLSKKVDPVVINVDVDANGTVKWNGTALQGLTEMALKLQAASQMQPQPELHIRAASKAKYEVVAGVMSSAQRNGLTKLGIVGVEQFIN